MVSNAFLKLWQRHNDFTTMEGIRSFLYTTVRNQCLDLIKHKNIVGAARPMLLAQFETESTESRMYQAAITRKAPEYPGVEFC